MIHFLPRGNPLSDPSNFRPRRIRYLAAQRPQHGGAPSRESRKTVLHL